MHADQTDSGINSWNQIIVVQMISPKSFFDGLKNHHTMDRFIHANKIKRTADDRYYVIESYPV